MPSGAPGNGSMPFWLQLDRPLGLLLSCYAGLIPFYSSTFRLWQGSCLIALDQVRTRSARFAQALVIGCWTGRAIFTRYRNGGNWDRTTLGTNPHPLATLPSGPGWDRPPSRILRRCRQARAIESLFIEIV